MSGVAFVRRPQDSLSAIYRLVSLARTAGDAVMSFYGSRTCTVVEKDGLGPVTDADRASHRIIVEGLSRDSDLPIVSEEGHIPDYDTRRGWSEFWLVDPLDGTKEFLSRNGEFTVNIALVRHGVPRVGVVFAPAQNVMYFAGHDCGAWRQFGDEPPQRLCSEPASPGKPLRVVESRSHRSTALDDFLATLPVAARTPVGSSLKFCRIAEGRADLYPRLTPIMEWDVAAGDCVYRYSGARGERSSPLRYNTPDLRIPRFIIGMEDVPPSTEAFR
jgi:3'(2'), 5'-bisphosphate nucleotidase